MQETGISVRPEQGLISWDQVKTRIVLVRYSLLNAWLYLKAKILAFT